jgi:arsenate reductase-like glutaredoxin family protein
MFFQDVREGVITIAKFLKKKLTEKQLADICRHLSLENTANNESINYENLAKGMGLFGNKPDQLSLRKAIVN